MLKSRGASADHEGTPRVSSEQILKLKLTFVPCQRILKERFINFKDFSGNP